MVKLNNHALCLAFVLFAVSTYAGSFGSFGGRDFSDLDDLNNPACCTAMTKECMACTYGITVEQLCEKESFRSTQYCVTKEQLEEKVDAATRLANETRIAAEAVTTAITDIMARNDLSDADKEREAREKAAAAFGVPVNGAAFEGKLRQSATQLFGQRLQECMSNASDVDGKQECRTTLAQETLQNSLGKTHIDQIEVEQYLQIAAMRSVENAVKTCMETASDYASRLVCRTSVAKTALEEILGRPVSNAEVQQYIVQGAQQATMDAMSNAMRTSGSAAEKAAAARDMAKHILAASLGKVNVTETEVQSFINEGATNAVANAMKDCATAARSLADKVNQSTALAACAFSSGKNALAASLGRVNISDADVERFVREGARHAAGDAMTSCIKAAGTNTTKKYACKTGAVKQVLEDSLGQTDVSAIDVERFVSDNARQAATKAMAAAMQVVSTNLTAKKAAARNAA